MIAPTGALLLRPEAGLKAVRARKARLIVPHAA
jgi:hypothetical protein